MALDVLSNGISFDIVANNRKSEFTIGAIWKSNRAVDIKEEKNG